MKLRSVLYTVFVIAFVATLSTLLILFAKGYTFNSENGMVEKTGWILAKSSPDGARIFLNGKLVDITNNSLPYLKPGTYHVKIQKEGYHEWEKELVVKEEYVTIAEAFLVSKAPEIRPLTSTGVKKPTPNHTGDQIAYFAGAVKKTGLWVLSLSKTGRLGISRNNPHLIAEGKAFEDIEEIIWSPDDSELLVKLKAEGTEIESYYLFETDKLNPSPYNSLNPTQTLQIWDQTLKQEKEINIEELKLDEKFREYALKVTTLFSSDGKKFLYWNIQSNEIEYRVYNSEKPLPVGKMRDTKVLKTNKDRDLKIFWHTTNEHLVILEDLSINIIETDGENQTSLFSGPLDMNNVFSTPDGRNIISLMSFKKDALPDLYAININ